MNEQISQPKAKRGRPSNAEKAARSKAESAPPKAAPRHKMKAKPNWEDINDSVFDETPDRLRIAKELIPQGMDLQWVTDSVFGQPMPQHRAEFEKRGWTPVHQEDFDGQFDGLWMARGSPGEIKVDGLVLMARPLSLSIKAKKIDRQRALERVQIKEKELRGGNLPGVTLDASHPNAVRTNMINRSMDGAFVPMAVPED